MFFFKNILVTALGFNVVQYHQWVQTFYSYNKLKLISYYQSLFEKLSDI